MIARLELMVCDELYNLLGWNETTMCTVGKEKF